MISIGMTSIRIHQAATPAQPLCLDARARFPAQAARVTEFLRGALMCLCIWPAHAWAGARGHGCVRLVIRVNVRILNAS